jgi:hypothetical protein
LSNHRIGLSKDGLDHATTLIRQICEVTGQDDLIDDVRASFAEHGLQEAVRDHDTDRVFEWLAEAVSFQGVSDSVASTFLEQHGAPYAADIRTALDGQLRCLKLKSYWHFEDCGYRKSGRICKQPHLVRSCPLPRLDLRNGSLNQSSYALHLFMRDVCGGDFVAWLDRRLEAADLGRGLARAKRLRDAVILPLCHVHGLSHKVLNMSLANLLLGAEPSRERWVTAGTVMIAVDTLIHNFLWRSGILGQLGAQHAYGPQCYRHGGCADILDRVSQRIDARKFNPDFPKLFPRFVQKAVWSFCAELGIDQCNGRRINDRKACTQPCPLARCQRVPLNPA